MILNRKKGISIVCIFLLAVLVLSGCGRSLVITSGFRRGEVFRIGSASGKIAEMRVYFLDLQKQNEALFGDAVWESGQAQEMQESIREQALARLTRVKALKQIGISRNVMLKTEEQRLAEEAEHNFYAGLSDAEKKYIDLDEKSLQQMFLEYALADKVWKSLGDSAEQEYEDFYEKTQCDLNTVYWQKIQLKKVEGDLQAPGFSACYEALFPEETDGEEAAAAEDAEEGTAQGQ